MSSQGMQDHFGAKSAYTHPKLCRLFVFVGIAERALRSVNNELQNAPISKYEALFSDRKLQVQ